MQYDGKNLLWQRHYSFWQQIQDVNLTEIWKNTNLYVLIFWGEYDIEAFSQSEHQTIVDIVNRYNSGKGTFKKLNATTHQFFTTTSILEGVKQKSDMSYMGKNFNPAIIDETDKWIKEIIKK